jgi:lysophospholipase L1-like esterase
MRLMRSAAMAVAALFLALAAPQAQPVENWVASWTGSAHGPYPVGNATAQPELKFALPSDAGASDQTFRLIVRPDTWGSKARIRLSNAFGTKPVTFDGVHVGLQSSGAVIASGTNRGVTFGGRPGVTVPPGKMAVSDPVALAWVRNPNDPLLSGRKLAISFHVAGDSGPITWHAKALTTSYLSGPGTGAHGGEAGEDAFPFSTTSWFFLDEVDMAVPGAKTVVAFGDSITDGTASTINGDDRWPDVFARRVHAAMGNRYSVVNEGIGGNRVVGPPDYAAKPFSGGPAALERLERDVTSLPNVSTVIWLEGINDFGGGGAELAVVSDGVREGVKRLRASVPGVKIFMATLTSSLHSTNGAYGNEQIAEKRRAYNEFVKSSGIFDGVVDFDAATIDPGTGELKAEYQPNSSTGGPGDKLHPNRAGYAAMGRAIDLGVVFGGGTGKR